MMPTFINIIKHDGIRLLAGIAALLLLLAPQPAAAQEVTGADGETADVGDISRVISVGSAVTETIFAVGAEETLVAVDESSTYPEAADELPKVSFTRNLSAEGLLSFSPSLILASGAAGPETAIRQIRSTGTSMLLLPYQENVEAALERIKIIGDVFEREQAAQELISELRAQLDEAARLRASRADEAPRVLFIYARGPNSLSVAGNATSAKTMIELAGGENAFDSFEGYKPLTAEAVVEADPDVILMMDSGLESVGGAGGVLEAPGISLTAAAENGRIHSMEGTYLLGFGPRLGDAVMDLMQLLYPDLEL
ncbi:MAG: heme/hemin ABC transporter substrate-binding protein [Cyclonatronaceae bacterium]